MEFSVQAFKVPKKGNSEDEYEDAFDYSLESRRFAMADGATESAYADRWARSLVKQYVLEPPFGVPPGEDAMQMWLLPQQMEWHASISWDTLPWFAIEKSENGGCAAFVGMEFGFGGTLWQRLIAKALPGEELFWSAFAVGDTCLFQVRNDSLAKSFPIEKSQDFNSRPLLLASVDKNNVTALKDIRSVDGSCRAGDLFILATDALAKWFLAEHEAGNKPWETMLEVKTDAEFAEWVAKIRTGGQLRNDDTTMLLLQARA